jgi:hypothetical protein
MKFNTVVLTLLIFMGTLFFGLSSMVSLADNTLDLPVVKPEYKDPSEKPKLGGAPLVFPPPEQPTTPPIKTPEPPPVFFGETIATNESIVYVLDYSQTMGIVAERVDYKTTLSRWDVVVKEATSSINRLSSALKFNIVVFGTNRGCSVSIWDRDLELATDENKASALSWLNGYQDANRLGGATPTAPAVLAALAMEPDTIVLLTDGQPSPCGLEGWPIRSHSELIKKTNTNHIRIDVFGIGLNPQPRMFCRLVASESGGVFYEIPTR